MSRSRPSICRTGACYQLKPMPQADIIWFLKRRDDRTRSSLCQSRLYSRHHIRHFTNALWSFLALRHSPITLLWSSAHISSWRIAGDINVSSWCDAWISPSPWSLRLIAMICEMLVAFTISSSGLFLRATALDRRYIACINIIFYVLSRLMSKCTYHGIFGIEVFRSIGISSGRHFHWNWYRHFDML